MRFDGKIGDSQTSSLRGIGTSAVFVARNRFAVMDAAKKVTINDLKNEATKSFNAPSNTESISYAGMKSILLITSTSVILYDAELRQNTAELPISSIRQAFWSSDLSMVAFIAKHAIVIANKKLEQLCIIHETVKIKSGAWDDAGVFVYSTLNHIKYLLPQG
jgi:coatomer protein complex subunit alpha (xenin)